MAPRDCCDCGATAGPLGLCADYYHAILVDEQLDPRMRPWHAVVVCVYLLQHPSRGHEKHLDGQFRMLQYYLDRGLDALLRFAAHQVARNNHRARSGYDLRPLEPYEPLPPHGRQSASVRASATFRTTGTAVSSPTATTRTGSASATSPKRPPNPGSPSGRTGPRPGNPRVICRTVRSLSARPRRPSG
ncbi:DUF5946 family protein [Nonomuraea antimicrobica]